MKKGIYFTAIIAGLSLSSCGGDVSEESEAKKCKTMTGAEADCKDVDALKELDKLSDDFVRLSLVEGGVSYEEFITKNEEVLKSMEAHLPALEKLKKAEVPCSIWMLMEMYFVKVI